MSILIKGMEMPKSCDKCELMTANYGCAFVGAVGGESYRKRAWDCPLVEVPPHGEWIHRTGNKDECSNCSARYYQDLKEPFMNYCPNCGARMEN